MKIYLASSFSLTGLVEYVSSTLERAGHKITVKWWSTDGFNLIDKKNDVEHPEAFYSEPVVKHIYDRDFRGILDADAFVFVADNKPKSYNGANVELGIALAFGLPCYCLGKLENSALYFPMQRCRDVNDLVSRLDNHPEKEALDDS